MERAIRALRDRLGEPLTIGQRVSCVGPGTFTTRFCPQRGPGRRHVMPISGYRIIWSFENTNRPPWVDATGRTAGGR